MKKDDPSVAMDIRAGTIIPIVYQTQADPVTLT